MWKMLIWFVILGCLSSVVAEENIVPGTFPPAEIQQKVHPLIKALRQAQADKNLKLVQQFSDDIKKYLGPWAGNPDSQPRYYSPFNSNQPDDAKLNRLWQETSLKNRKNAIWLTNPSGDPDKMTRGLRQVARPLVALATYASKKTKRTKVRLAFIKTGADYLIGLQRPNGLFPLPDLRGDDQRYSYYNRRAIQQSKSSLENGWFIDDYRGELQFDHAICGVAMLLTYKLTGEKQYLNSALRAGNWAESKASNTNWAYNAFSAWFLSELYEVSGKANFLNSAIEKLKIGVLPGLTKTGRWFDPINSKLIYHASNVRGMLAVYHQLPDDDHFKKGLKKMIYSALNNAAEQIVKNGASSITTSTSMLVEGLVEFGQNNLWQAALNININAGLAALDDPRAPSIGVFLPEYMEYREKLDQEKAAK